MFWHRQTIYFDLKVNVRNPISLGFVCSDDFSPFQWVEQSSCNLNALLRRGISLFMPDSSKQKEVIRKWTQQESIAVLGSGSYFLKQPDRLFLDQLKFHQDPRETINALPSWGDE